MTEPWAYRNREAVEAHGSKADSVAWLCGVIGGAIGFILVDRESGTVAALHDKSTISLIAMGAGKYSIDWELVFASALCS
jgi:hypothetical protein